ncbi:MAG: hypothetical protein ACM3H8_14720 [Sphingobacteriales bacterium]
MKLLVAVIFSAVLAGCKKSEDTTILDGVYAGTFYRSHPWSDTATVILNFSGNHFTGQSNKNYYPAICSGTYTVTGNKIHFENSCPWTANFDWSFILSNDFSFTVNGKKLEMVRSYDGIIFYSDNYQLTKQ